MEQDKKVITAYQLEDLVRRCFKEAERAGMIKAPVTYGVIMQNEELIQHISRSIIGELHELELIRRLQPIFRAIKSLATEFESLDKAAMKEARSRGPVQEI